MDIKKNGNDQSNSNGENDQFLLAFKQLQIIGNNIAQMPPDDLVFSEPSLRAAESDIFSYPNKIVRQVICDSNGKSWRHVLDSLYARFGWVYEHSVNVALISVMIAIELNFDKASLLNLALGGFLHDVGKLLVPITIIQKKSSLNKAEMNLIRKHSELGMSLVASCGIRDDCMAVILQHHERLDGSGYPYGLHSNQIHPYAKIAMIADVLDAMTSYRPYRPAKSFDEAISIIKNEGSKFCAEYVAVVGKLHQIISQ